MAAEPGAAVRNLPFDSQWLAAGPREPVLDPALPIIDPHHHLWERPGFRYLLPELLEDIDSGHNVRGTVYVEAGSMYRQQGPDPLRPVGETEFARGTAASGATGDTRVCAGIIGSAALSLGEAVTEVLAAHVAAGYGRLCGVRQSTAWDASAALRLPYPPPKRPVFAQMLGDAKFREGFGCLASHGLAFDAWLYHTQLPELAGLARAFPTTTIVVDHLGGPLRVGPYSGRDDSVHAAWKANIAELARCPNVFVKLGGLGMRSAGFDLPARPAPAGSEELAALWRPYVATAIEAFGPQRCMFESNFPVDKASAAYPVLWNAFKRLASGCSAAEKGALFGETARRVYGLKDVN